MKSAQMKERELIIKLHNKGRKQEQIASILACSQSKVSFWIIRNKKEGSLENKPHSGRPSNFSPEKLALLKARIVRKVVSRNLKYSSCTSKELRYIISKKIKKTISLRHARRMCIA